MTKKLRDGGINVSRETVQRKLKTNWDTSKVPVEGHDLSSQQKEVRQKWCKKCKNIDDWDNLFFIEGKTFKTINKKKRR